MENYRNEACFICGSDENKPITAIPRMGATGNFPHLEIVHLECIDIAYDLTPGGKVLFAQIHEESA